MSNLRTMLETALNAGHNALDMRCDDLPLLRDELLRYNDFTSRACYRWVAGSGLTRIDMPHITVPNTGSFEQALQHLISRPHFAIYLFEDLRDEFKVVSTWQLLRRLVADRSPQRKLLIFAGQGLQVPDHMKDIFIETQFRSQVHGSQRSRVA